MYLDFMTPDVWDGLVLAVIFIGGAFALLRLYRDLSGPSRWLDRPDEHSPVAPPTPAPRRSAGKPSGTSKRNSKQTRKK